VIPPLEAALVSEQTGARAAAMRYFLGIAYAKGGALDKAISYLQAAIAADVEHDDARFQLASALDRSGAYAKARTEYDKFATAHPQSQFSVFAMRRSATLARMPANAPAPDPKADPHAGSAVGSAAKPAPPAAKPITPPPTKPVAPPAAKPVVPAPAPVAPPPAKPVAPAPQPAAPTPAPETTPPPVPID
jgi:hypothetical protein